MYILSFTKYFILNTNQLIAFILNYGIRRYFVKIHDIKYVRFAPLGLSRVNIS